MRAATVAHATGGAAPPLVSVVGSGAIGGLLAALLWRAGRPVELVCRPSNVEVLQRGIRVRMAGDTFTTQPPVRTMVSRQATLIVLAVKLPDLEAACRSVAQLFGGEHVPPILLLQNGLLAVDVARRVLPGDRLLCGIVELGSTMLTPGDITWTMGGRLIVGAPAGGSADAAEAAAVLLRAAVPVSVSGEIAAAQRLKLIINLNNGATAATGLTVQALYARPAGLLLSLQLMREGMAVFNTTSLPLERSRRTRLLRALLALPNPLAAVAFRLGSRRLMRRYPVYSSTLQSVLRGRPTEIDELNGAIVRLGEQHGIATPLNRAVVAAVAAASTTGPPVFTTPEALLGQSVPAAAEVRTAVHLAANAPDPAATGARGAPGEEGQP